jgi:hypothetical protein
MSASFSFLDVVQVVIEQDHFLGQDNRARVRKRVNWQICQTEYYATSRIKQCEEIVKKGR